MNDPPTAREDIVYAEGGIPVEIDVLANDSDVESDLNPDVQIETPPANGVILGIDSTTGIITYRPDDDFQGIDVFQYRVFDTGHPLLPESAVGTVTIAVSQTDITVDTLDDNNDGDFGPGNISLREALLFVVGGGTVTFDPAIFGPGLNTIVLTLGELPVTRDIFLTGPGADHLEVSGENTSRVLHVKSGTLVCEGMPFVRGDSADTGGGAIRVDAGAGMVLNGGIVADSQVRDTNGQLDDLGGGIFSAGDLVLKACSITGNTAGAFGGGVYSGGSLSVINCTFSGNTAVLEDGGAVDAGAYEVRFHLVDLLEDEDDGNTGPGDCSLREAVGLALPGDNIEIGLPGLIVLNPALGVDLGEISIPNSLGIRGYAPGETVISGGNATPIFYIPSISTQLILWDIDFQEAFDAPQPAGAGRGGAVANALGGTTSISFTEFQNNTALVSGGALHITNNVTVRISNSLFHVNSANSDGGAINNFGHLTLVNSTISGNIANRNGGGINHTGTLLQVLNTTITGNTADAVNSGVAEGGGICVTGPASLQNTVVAGNFDTPGNAGQGNIRADISGTVLSLGNNLLGNNNGSAGIVNGQNGNLAGTSTQPLDPRLGPLDDNGGPLMSLMPMVASPLIDGGNNDGVVSPPFDDAPYTDQRGAPFIRIVDGTGDGEAVVDIGVIEYVPTQPQFTSDSVENATEDEVYLYTVVMDDADLEEIFTITAPVLPYWISFTDHGDGTATLTGTPSNEEVQPTFISRDYDVQIDVVDWAGVTNTQSFTITLQGVNDAPVANDDEAVGRAVKADAKIADTRLVMLTSLGARGDARRLQEIGFAAYATKPVRHEELKGVLSQALNAGPDGAPRPIATRHTAREALPNFAHFKARILLAEDNITNQQVALGILKKLGLTAVAVANGREAIEALKTLPYDLVLMDVQMPEMDGWEATRQIRTLQPSFPNRNIPIIAMTAHAMQGDKNKCLESGMNDYLSKPVSPSELAELLLRWLPNESRGRNQAPEAGIMEAKPDQRPSPVIWDRAGMLERLMGDEELAATILQGFLADIPRQIQSLRGYLEAEDAPSAERQAHTIKGASANVGAEALRALTLEMEKAGQAGDLDSIKASLQELDAAFEEFKKEAGGKS